jgi:polyvinyl alcohol dehydrogenase (cytochrome)
MIRLTLTALAITVAMLPGLARAQTPRGGVLFEQHCMSCHRNPAPGSHAPNRDAMSQFKPERVLTALTTGPMAAIAQAAGLTDAQKRSIAEFITLRPLGSAGVGQASAMPNQCRRGDSSFDPSAGPSWNGWSPGRGNTRFQPADSAGMTGKEVPDLKLKWAFGSPGATSMYSLPTVVGGRVFFGNDAGFVYSIDAETGCVHWSFEAITGVRTALLVAPIGGGRRVRHAAFFGDLRSNVYAVDAESGKLLWSKHVDDHPLSRITGGLGMVGESLLVPVSSWEETAGATPTYECCTFRGSTVMLNARTGEQVWKSYTIPEKPAPVRKNSLGTQLWAPAGVAIWSTPTVDEGRGTIFITTGNAYTAPAALTSDALLAVDIRSGGIKWWRQFLANDAWLLGCNPKDKNRTENCPDVALQNISYNDMDIGASAILTKIPDGRSALIVAGESGGVYAVDPDKQGALIWQTHLGDVIPGQYNPGIGLGAAVDEGNAYFALERYTGGLTAISLATGERVWHTPGQKANCAEGVIGCSSQQQGAVTVIPGAIFSGASDGKLRAYSTTDGSIIWEYDTARAFDTVNKVAAKGGSIRGPGVTVVGGTLFSGSGYGALGGMPGNVLLAFGLEK